MFVFLPCDLDISSYRYFRRTTTLRVMNPRSRSVVFPTEEVCVQPDFYSVRHLLDIIMPTTPLVLSIVFVMWCSRTLTRVGGSQVQNTMKLIELLLAPAGLPGNDDQAAMATLLSFHLLGLYPGNNTLLSVPCHLTRYNGRQCHLRHNTSFFRLSFPSTPSTIPSSTSAQRSLLSTTIPNPFKRLYHPGRLRMS